MKLDSFKELLIKRAADMPDLQTLIKYMKDDFLLEHVLEALEKSESDKRDKRVNESVRHFGTGFDHSQAGALHDALSHHASHYYASMKANNKPLAQAHAKALFRLMHMGRKITKDVAAENNKHAKILNVQAPDPRAWESTYYGNHKSKDNPKVKHMIPEGWARDSGPINEWLQSHPQENYDEDAKKYKDQAYPLHEISVNGKYIDINPNVELPTSTKKLARGLVEPVNHLFDSHPIMGVYNIPGHKHNENHDKYVQDADNWENSDDVDAFHQKLQQNPSTRGDTKSAPVELPYSTVREKSNPFPVNVPSNRLASKQEEQSSGKSPSVAPAQSSVVTQDEPPQIPVQQAPTNNLYDNVQARNAARIERHKQ
jgi:hypothetical protein